MSARKQKITPLNQELFQILERYAPGEYDRREIWERLGHYLPTFDPREPEGAEMTHLELETVQVNVIHIKGTAFYLLPV